MNVSATETAKQSREPIKGVKRLGCTLISRRRMRMR
jgi:hypothetical protein